MTTYTTPHFATGLPQRSNVRTEPSLNRARPASATAYQPGPLSSEAVALADGPTADWQPGAARSGVPKAAIGTLGAALVGGVALAIVMLAPSNRVTKQVAPDPIAQAAAQTGDAQKPVDSNDAAFNKLEGVSPVPANAAATPAAPTATAPAAAATPATPAAVQSVIPDASPVANAPVARLPRHTPAPAAAPRVQPVQAAPAVTPDVPAPAPVVTPPADVQAPAMQQTPDTPTVTPTAPAPVTEQPVPVPVPAPTE